MSEGTFIVSPATAFLMYAPEIYGRSEVQTVKVTKESEVIFTKAPKETLKKLVKQKRQIIAIAIVFPALVGTGVLFMKKRGVTFYRVREKIRQTLGRRGKPPTSPSQDNSTPTSPGNSQNPQ